MNYTDMLKIYKCLENIIKDIDTEPLFNMNKGYLQILCDQQTLYKLPPDKFRILEFKSEEFEKEEDAKELSKLIKSIEGYENNIDINKVVTYHGKDKRPRHYVSVTTTNDSQTIKQLRDNRFKIKLKKWRGKPKRKAREQQYDPLQLNSPSWQLAAFNHIHTEYHPEYKIAHILHETTKPTEFALTKNNPSQSMASQSLELAIEDAVKFYKANMAAWDLETTRWIAGKNLSGEIVYSVIGLPKESILISSREGWGNEEIGKKLKEKYEGKTKSGKQRKLIFVEEDIDVIDATYQILKNIPIISTHNGDQFDQPMAMKYNDALEALKQRSKTLKHRGKFEKYQRTKKILDERKQNGDIKGSKKLWVVRNIMDTYPFLRGRVQITPDYRLSTMRGFDKHFSWYDEMKLNFKRGDFKSLDANMAYTLNDEKEQELLTHKLLRAMVIESIATNKPISNVSRSNPTKNFWDATKRKYLMLLNTYKDRHDLFPMQHLNKIKERHKPDEIIAEALKHKKQEYGMIEGYLGFSDVMINAFSKVIENDPVRKLIREKIFKEEDPIIKNIYYTLEMDSLLVLVDKIRDYIERSGLEFGKKYSPQDLFETIDMKISEKRDELYGLYDGDKIKPSQTDLEKSRESYIWSKSAGIKNEEIQKGLCLYDLTLLNYNNIISDELQKFKEQKIKGFGQNVYIFEEEPKINLGKGTFINMKGQRIIGKIGNRRIQQGIKTPKSETIETLIEKALDGEKINIYEENENLMKESETNNKIKTKDNKFTQSVRLIMKTITGYDPQKLKTKGDLLLDFKE